MQVLYKGKFNYPFDEKDVSTFWNSQKKANPDKTLFNAHMYCVNFNDKVSDSNEEHLTLYDIDFKHYLYATKVLELPICCISVYCALKTLDDKYLIVKRSSRVAINPLKFSIVGGHVSNHYKNVRNINDLLKTVKVEITEELGIDQLFLENLNFSYFYNYSSQTEHSERFFFITQVNLNVDDFRNLLYLNKEEIEEVLFLSDSELANLEENVSDALLKSKEHIIDYNF